MKLIRLAVAVFQSIKYLIKYNSFYFAAETKLSLQASISSGLLEGSFPTMLFIFHGVLCLLLHEVQLKKLTKSLVCSIGVNSGFQI